MIQLHNEKVAYQQGYEDGFRQGKQFILDKVVKLKKEYVDTCNMCTHTKSDSCKIDEFIAELNRIISE